MYALVQDGIVRRLIAVGTEFMIGDTFYHSWWWSMADEATRNAAGLFPCIPFSNPTPDTKRAVSTGWSFNESMGVAVETADLFDIPQAELDKAEKQRVLAQIVQLEQSITDRMWREDAIGSTDVMTVPNRPDGSVDPRNGKTATQYIAWVNTECRTLAALVAGM